MSRNLNDLLPIVKIKAQDFIQRCKDQGITILVTCTYRSLQEQDILYAQGRTASGSIVTNAKGGQSFHNWRVAFDIVPIVNGKCIWNNNALWSKLGQIGQSVGLEWGGSWKSFPDVSHLQYTLGYSFNDFINKKVDLTKFN